MNISFNTENLTELETQGIILLLSRLFPESALIPAPAHTVSPIQQAESEPNTAPVPNGAAEPAARRGRRSKAEIAAAAENQAASGPEPVVPAPTEGIASPTPATTSNTPITADEFRTLLSAYIARHSMDDAVGKLKAFGCSRVSEALALDPEKINGLAESLRG